jgi:hypothetical protein
VVPWEALEFSHHDQRFILNVEKELLKEAPRFDKDHWPSIEDRQFAREVCEYYGWVPYWEYEQTQTRNGDGVESQGEVGQTKPGRLKRGFPSLLPNHEVDQCWAQWNAIQAEFVDNPETSVKAADSLVAQVLEDLVASYHFFCQQDPTRGMFLGSVLAELLDQAIEYTKPPVCTGGFFLSILAL